MICSQTRYTILLLLICPVFVEFALGQVGEPTTISDTFPDANPVEGEFSMHTSLYTQIPNEKPNFITSYMGDMIVSTFKKIYRIGPNKVPELFLDLEDALAALPGGYALDTSNSQHGGVRSVAFHPKKTRFMYVSMMEFPPPASLGVEYLTNVPGAISNSVVAEFKLNKARTAVDPSSYRQVIRIGVPQVTASSYDHPIKTMAFRKKELYIAHGDAADQVASSGGGQNLADAFGKILRIKPLKKKSTGEAYTVPSGNPYIGVPGTLKEIWASGFRNPHHLCFGDGKELYIGETGRNDFEEVNVLKNKGANCGWANREGWEQFAPGSGAITPLDENDPEDAAKKYTYPAAGYGHATNRNVGQAMGGGCPVTNNSPMKGLYMFFDFPVEAYLYYSKVSELLQAVTTGKPSGLTRATVFQMKICYTSQGGQTLALDNLQQVLNTESTGNRADIRMGRGPGGVMYWSSKRNGNIYKIDSSEPGGSISAC